MTVDPPPALDLGSGTAPLRVLVAEDHPAVRAGLVAALDAHPDITVVGEAGDGPRAVDLARALRPGVVLTDVRMPGATGIDIIPDLLETGARVLVISAFDLDAYVLAALSRGADGYLVKSESPARIVDAVRAVASGDPVLSPAATRAVVARLRTAPTGGPGVEAAGGPRVEAASMSRDAGAESRNRPGSDTGGLPREVRDQSPGGAALPGGAAVPPLTTHSPASPLAPHTPLTPREEDVLRLIGQGLSNQQISRELVVELTTVKSHVTHVLAKLQVDSRLQAALWWGRHRG